MTIFKIYLSNLSAVWPITRQEEVLAGLEGTKFCDELPASERRGFRINGLAERGHMLRRTIRQAEQVIQVASLACFARNAEDLMVALSEAAEVNATIRDVSANMDIKPSAKAKDMKAVAKLFAEGRKKAAEVVRGQTGGQASGKVRAALARQIALKFSADWQDFKKNNQQIVEESGLSINTLRLYLGHRREARSVYVAKIKRGTYMPRKVETPTDAVSAFVYLMRREDGVYKVGVSANPAKRARDLRKDFKKRLLYRACRPSA